MVLVELAKFVTPKFLRLKAAIDSVYSGVLITDVYINTEEYVLPTGPDTEHCVYHGEFNTTSIDEQIDLTDAVMSGAHMYFIYIKITGTPVPEPPCGYDNIYTLAMAVDGSEIYQKAFNLIKCQKGCGCVDDQCSVSAKMANFALEWFRMTTSMNLGLSTEALESFNKLMGRIVPTKEVYSNCNCHA